MTDLLQLFLGLPLFLLPWGFHSRATFNISPSSFLNVWAIHLNFIFLISRFISSWSVALHKSLLEIMFGHHILKIYLRHRLTRTCILRRISLVTSHVSHPYKGLHVKSCNFSTSLNSWCLKPTYVTQRFTVYPLHHCFDPCLKQLREHTSLRHVTRWLWSRENCETDDVLWLLHSELKLLVVLCLRRVRSSYNTIYLY